MGINEELKKKKMIQESHPVPGEEGKFSVFKAARKREQTGSF